jgi:hypothetical protein
VSCVGQQSVVRPHFRLLLRQHQRSRVSFDKARMGNQPGVTTSAIEHLRRGMNVVELQKMLGHKDLETTRKYLTALKGEDVEIQALRTSPVEHWAGGGPWLTGATPEANAVAWCADYSATVTFSRVNGTGRVTVCVGGFLMEEGASLVEAVNGAQRKIERFMAGSGKAVGAFCA